MIAVYILAVLWSGGCTFGYCAALKGLWEDGDTVFFTLVVCIGLPIFLFMAALPWALIEHESSPTLATLKKGDWACASSHVETTMIMAGKVLVPSTHSVCDTYVRQ